MIEYEEYGEIYIPNLGAYKSLRGEFSFLKSGPSTRCIIDRDAVILTTDHSHYDKICYGLDCGTCLCGSPNYAIALEYFIDKGYITKGEALDYVLRDVN